jgi:glycosyltransferase involved in cell wall biosynthesis
VAATLIGEAVGTALASAGLGRRTGNFVPVRIPMRDLFASGAAIAGLWTFASVDSLLARHSLGSLASGNYIAANNAARSLLVIPQALLVVALPRFVTMRRVRHGTEHASVVGVLLLTGAITAILGSLIVAFDQLVLRVVFGSAFIGAVPLLGPLVAATGATALVTVCTHRDIARRSSGAYLAWVGAALEVGLILRFHESGTRIAGMALVASVALAFVALAAAVRTNVPPQSPAFLVGDLFAPGLEYQPIRLSLVVPFFDATSRSAINVRQIVEVLRESVDSFEVIAVSDGSTPLVTAPLVDADDGRSLRLFRLPENCGKGAAVRFGLSQARGQYIGFIDADGDIPFAQLPRFLEAMRVFSPDIVYGSKSHPLSVVVRSSVRSTASSAFRLLARALLGVGVRDTQCGLKVMQREVAKAVLPWLESAGFSFDVELFAVARRLGYDRFLEAPVTIVGRGGSTVSVTAAARAVADLIRIRRRVKKIPPEPSRKEDSSTAASLPTGLREAISESRVRPLRILVLNWRDSAHPVSGGSELYIDEITRRWASWGHDVTWFSASAKGAPSDERRDGVYHVRRGGRYTVFRQARRFLIEHRSSFDLVLDVINTRPFGAPRHTHAPVVALAHQVAREVWFYEVPRTMAALGFLMLEPMWLRRYKLVPTLTVSESSRHSLMRYGLRRIRIVPVGVDAPATRKRFTKAQRPTILFCGRLVRSKRPEDAIQAVSIVRTSLPDAELVILGDGPIAGELRRDSPEFVRFLGRVDAETKLEAMARADALVVTSVREGWGLVVSEAASVGTRTVAYDVDGLRDSVAAAGGVLCRPTPAGLAETLLEVLPRWRAEPYVHDEHGGVLNWTAVAVEVLAAAVFDGNVEVDIVSSLLRSDEDRRELRVGVETAGRGGTA